MIEDVLDARKNRIDAEEAWELFERAKSVRVAKGKKVISFVRGESQKETILKQIMGPSGNLRAPTLRIGDDFIVGFHAEMYADYFNSA